MSTAKTFGPYDGKKQAMRANCMMSMKGEFSRGVIIRTDGELMMTTACRAYRHGDVWLADVTLRPLTEQEKESVRVADLRKEYSGLLILINNGGGWNGTDAGTMEHVARARTIKAELDALEASEKLMHGSSEVA